MESPALGAKQFAGELVMVQRVGTRLGPYEIWRRSAQAAWERCIARDSKLNRDVALKILPAMFTNDADWPASAGKPRCWLRFIIPTLGPFMGWKSGTISAS
jgi:hypothetical protein